jgi:hypothetical protein
VFHRALHEYGNERYTRLASISVSHLYNQRHSPGYKTWQERKHRAAQASGAKRQGGPAKAGTRHVSDFLDSGFRQDDVVLSCPPEGGRSSQIETIQVHHFHPGGDEIHDEFFLGVRAGVNLGQGAQYRIGAEDQVGAGCRPFLRACLAIPALEYLGFVLAVDRLPFGCAMSNRLTKKSLVSTHAALAACSIPTRLPAR